MSTRKVSMWGNSTAAAARVGFGVAIFPLALASIAAAPMQGEQQNPTPTDKGVEVQVSKMYSPAGLEGTCVFSVTPAGGQRVEKVHQVALKPAEDLALSSFFIDTEVPFSWGAACTAANGDALMSLAGDVTGPLGSNKARYYQGQPLFPEPSEARLQPRDDSASIARIFYPAGTVGLVITGLLKADAGVLILRAELDGQAKVLNIQGNQGAIKDVGLTLESLKDVAPFRFVIQDSGGKDLVTVQGTYTFSTKRLQSDAQFAPNAPFDEVGVAPTQGQNRTSLEYPSPRVLNARSHTEPGPVSGMAVVFRPIDGSPGQTATNQSGVRVSLTHPDGKPAAGTGVRLSGPLTGDQSLVRREETDAQGTVSFLGLKPGKYELTVDGGDGHAPETLTVTVTGDEIVPVQVALHESLLARLANLLKGPAAVAVGVVLALGLVLLALRWLSGILRPGYRTT